MGWLDGLVGAVGKLFGGGSSEKEDQPVEFADLQFAKPETFSANIPMPGAQPDAKTKNDIDAFSAYGDL
jgi:hypothetical protein